EVQGVPPPGGGEGQGALVRRHRRGPTRGHAPGHSRLVSARRCVRHASVIRCRGSFLRFSKSPSAFDPGSLSAPISHLLTPTGTNSEPAADSKLPSHPGRRTPSPAGKSRLTTESSVANISFLTSCGRRARASSESAHLSRSPAVVQFISRHPRLRSR